MPGGGTEAMIVLPDILLARATEWLSPGSVPRSPLQPVVLPEWSGVEDQVPLLYAAGADDEELVQRDGSRFFLRLDLLGSIALHARPMRSV